VQEAKKLVGASAVNAVPNLPYKAVGITPTLTEILGSLSISPAGALAQLRAIQNALNGLGALARNANIGTYHGSVMDGEANLKRMIQQEIAWCGPVGTKLLLDGYSQGAQVTADVYQSLNSQQRQFVLGVVLFGDPRYNHLSFAAIAPRDNNGILPVRGEFPADSRGKVLSYCHARDPICQGLGQLVLHGDGAHKTYSTLGEPQAAADILLKNVTAKPTPPAPDGWPTHRHDGPPALFVYLGASSINPEWSSCNSDYCIVGSGYMVYVFSIRTKLVFLGEAETANDPRLGLAPYIPPPDLDELLDP